jgi:hypothetical protein
MEKLRSTEHHYIRCLKPNQTLKAGDWDNDFMLKQLAYSGTLEVTQIRKAGLNVRRPLKHFYQYYRICADDPASLRAGTVTKRCELLLKQLAVDPNKYRVGKTLLFLQNNDIIDGLDKVREHRILGLVITLQSFFRMLKYFVAYRKIRRAILRLQGFCKSWEIRRAYIDVRVSARLLQRHARTHALTAGGARGGEGARGGKGGGGGARGGGGFEHTRQPVETLEVSETQAILPLPNTKLEGPFVSSVPLNCTIVPAVFGILRKSYPASVEKAVAVMLLPMASAVGVMVHVWLTA